MYHLNSQLPAPYELQNQPPQMARGGHAKSKKMVVAHFNPKELHAMDHLQGNQERCPKSGLRCYSHLEELIKNPHIAEKIHHHARRHHAEGGSTYGTPELEHLAQGGQHGDSELALIGPHTHHLFNQLAGHATNNPHTGHPEYWSLGGALGGLWNGIKGAAPGLAQMGAQALGNKIGGPMGQAVSSGLGQAAQAYGNGATGAQAFGAGLHGAGGQLGGGLGGAMQGAGSAVYQGKGLGGAMRQGAQGGLQGMGGLSGLAGMGANAFANRGKPGGMLGAMGQQMKQAALPGVRPESYPEEQQFAQG